MCAGKSRPKQPVLNICAAVLHIFIHHRVLCSPSSSIMAAPAPADEDLYAILGASIDSTDDELKKAYRALAIKVE